MDKEMRGQKVAALISMHTAKLAACGAKHKKKPGTKTAAAVETVDPRDVSTVPPTVAPKSGVRARAAANTQDPTRTMPGRSAARAETATANTVPSSMSGPRGHAGTPVPHVEKMGPRTKNIIEHFDVPVKPKNRFADAARAGGAVEQLKEPIKRKARTLGKATTAIDLGDVQKAMRGHERKQLAKGIGKAGLIGAGLYGAHRLMYGGRDKAAAAELANELQEAAGPSNTMGAAPQRQNFGMALDRLLTGASRRYRRGYKPEHFESNPVGIDDVPDTSPDRGAGFGY